ncbi:MAG: ribulokinase [Anaerolineae bacterium]|nr:ribulokinase [Anaerolineae bacterium]MDQ7036618.1 ribulokinase [Anaerolineae bacterium]
MYTIGIDFGTLSGRALLVDTRDGREIATAVFDYPHAVLDKALPSGKSLPPEWALQHPQDYLDVFTHTIPAVLKTSGVDPQKIVGLAVDFTASSPMPTKTDGTPLCFLDEYKDEPHAYVKLWKHHAAQSQADRINDIARERGESWLKRYGGKYSSEWFFSKLLQILDESSAIYREIDVFIEAADWVIWQLTGVMTRNTCTAGYKMLVQDGKYPSSDYFAALNPSFENVIAEKVQGDFTPLGGKVGTLTEEMAAKLGLQSDVAVAVANVDAHVTAPAVKATQSGVMVMIMGTSTCHIMSADSLEEVDGMCGVVDGGIIDGLYGYEAGQSAVGDIFAWFVDNAVAPEYHEAAKAVSLNLHDYLEQEAAKQQVGEHGLIALDWWNGNRSTLVDTELGGLLVGATLATRAPDIYRALIESTAFGTREIIEAFEARGVKVKELIAAGGLPDKNALLRQIYADVTGRTFKLAGSSQSPALGSAMHAAVAAGIYPDINAAAEKMGKLKDEVVSPIPENQVVYDQLYTEYKTLYNYFGRGANDVMKRLKKIRNEVRGESV